MTYPEESKGLCLCLSSTGNPYLDIFYFFQIFVAVLSEIIDLAGKKFWLCNGFIKLVNLY